MGAPSKLSRHVLREKRSVAYGPTHLAQGSLASEGASTGQRSSLALLHNPSTFSKHPVILKEEEPNRRQTSQQVCSTFSPVTKSQVATWQRHDGDRSCRCYLQVVSCQWHQWKHMRKVPPYSKRNTQITSTVRKDKALYREAVVHTEAKPAGRGKDSRDEADAHRSGGLSGGDCRCENQLAPALPDEQSFSATEVSVQGQLWLIQCNTSNCSASCRSKKL